MAVSVGHQLVGAFGRGVELQRMIDTDMFGKRHLGVCTVDARRAGICQVLDLVMPARFQQVGEADNV